jgi:Spy/CpxP family protein refolding chaperone
MRLVLTLLLAATVAGPALAQQAKPVQPQPSQAPPPSQAKPSSQEEIMRQRILLREKFNKGWDIQPETPKDRERRCKNEAKKQFSALHPLKRRRYVKECVAHAGH